MQVRCNPVILLLDTNILIYLSKKEVELDNFANSGDLIGISVITYMEALGFSFQNKQEENIMEALCENLDGSKAGNR